jgi:hypothetical protein
VDKKPIKTRQISLLGEERFILKTEFNRSTKSAVELKRLRKLSKSLSPK